MSRNFQIMAQLLATFGQVMMDPMQAHFKWEASLSQLFHAMISFAQLALGILAHSYNVDGTAAGQVPQTTIHETIPQPGQGPTVITAVVEPVERKRT